MTKYGEGALLAKVDIDAAYHLIPVHPQNQPLQAMLWEGCLYIDSMLPFGLWSAPNAVADTLNWYLHQQGIEHVYHYLGDFIVIGSPGSHQCQEALAMLEATCSTLASPLLTTNRRVHQLALCSWEL